MHKNRSVYLCSVFKDDYSVISAEQKLKLGDVRGVPKIIFKPNNTIVQFDTPHSAAIYIDTPPVTFTYPNGKIVDYGYAFFNSSSSQGFYWTWKWDLGGIHVYNLLDNRTLVIMQGTGEDYAEDYLYGTLTGYIYYNGIRWRVVSETYTINVFNNDFRGLDNYL